MTREKLSKKQFQAFHHALEPLFLTGFPNPERKDCPGMATLHAIAHKTLPIQNPAIDHVGSCSPCFSELQEIRTGMRRQHFLWVAATATASILIVAAMLGYVAFRTPTGDSPVQSQIQRTPQAAMLDLRNFSLVRGESPAPTPSSETLQLNRSPLELTIQLPVGAEEGPYELQIRQNDQPPLATAKGEARIENQVTTLHVQIDTNHIPPGDYRLALRHADFNWRYYPVEVH